MPMPFIFPRFFSTLGTCGVNMVALKRRCASVERSVDDIHYSTKVMYPPDDNVAEMPTFWIGDVHDAFVTLGRWCTAKERPVILRAN